MIAHLHGVLEHIDKNHVVVEVGEIGYRVKVSAGTLAKLPKIGAKIKLYTEQVVREDDISLYGFLSREERNLFVTLMSVSGIGPKAALSFLAAFPIAKLVSAIAGGDDDLLSSVSGIGKKTAQKVIIELKEKVAKMFTLKPSEEKSVVTDAISALISLGYTPKEAREVIQKNCADLEKMSLEEIVKQALRSSV